MPSAPAGGPRWETVPGPGPDPAGLPPCWRPFSPLPPAQARAVVSLGEPRATGAPTPTCPVHARGRAAAALRCHLLEGGKRERAAVARLVNVQGAQGSPVWTEARRLFVYDSCPFVLLLHRWGEGDVGGGCAAAPGSREDKGRARASDPPASARDLHSGGAIPERVLCCPHHCHSLPHSPAGGGALRSFPFHRRGTVAGRGPLAPTHQAVFLAELGVFERKSPAAPPITP